MPLCHMDKTLLVYRDIRLSKSADARMMKFIARNMSALAVESCSKFDEYKDFLKGFAARAMPYEEFAGRVRKRSRDEAEDFDEDLHPPFPEHDR